MKKVILSTIIVLLLIQCTIAQIGLEVNQGTNINNVDEKNGYAIIGDESGSNITFDNNEVQTKNANLPDGTLFINDRAGQVSMLGSSAGNLTVGGYNGLNKLTVRVEGSDGIRIAGNNMGNIGLQFINETGSTSSIFDDFDDNNTLVIQSHDEIAFNSNLTTEAMRIQNNGDIQIGPEIPFVSYPVTVNATNDNVGLYVANDFASGGTSGIYSESTAGGTGNRYGVQGFSFAAATGEVIGVRGVVSSSTATSAYGVFGSAIDGTGTTVRYGVYGTASVDPNHYAVFANGDMCYTGTLCTPSDRRLKKNILRANPNLLDKVMQLNVVTYDYDNDTYKHMNLAQGQQIGFLAQELEEIFPLATKKQKHAFHSTQVSKSDDNEVIVEEYIGVDYIKLIPILTKAIQEQQVQIEDLQAEVELLRK